jgi:hypothetical protein
MKQTFDKSFSNDDFQIINMNYKLKKIKNKKKRNHEKKNSLLETLDNTSGAVDNGPEIPSFSGETVREAFIEGYPDNEYDGIDNVDDSGEKLRGEFDPRKWIIEMIEKIYAWINKFNQYWASKIVKILSKGTGKESDVNLVRNYIAWTESIAAGCYVVYNWFFIMYYSKVADIKLYEIDIVNILKTAKENKDTGALEQIWFFFIKIIHYFFDYSLVIMMGVNKIVSEIIPKYTTIFNSTFIFAILFFNCCQFLKYSALVVKKTIIKSILFEVTPVSGLIYTAIFILWGAGLFKGIFDMVDSPTPKNPILYILYILERLIKLIIQFIIGVPTTSLVVVIYFLIYSFFGVFIYAGKDMFSKINDYVKVTKSSHIYNVCDGYHWYDYFYEVLELIMTFVDTLHGKLFTITFMLLYAYSCIDYSKNITPDTYQLKNGLLAINIGLIVTCLSMIVDYFSKHMPKPPPEE